MTPEIAAASRWCMDRLKLELTVIEKTGFISYFLIVGDFIRKGREMGVACVARGSAAGSMVTYLLEIANVDPIRYGLLFERFLNPERVNPPDIDIDFADDRRADVIEYVREKYGNDSVAQIITFGTMGAKSVVRDVGRVMGLSYGEVRPAGQDDSVRFEDDARKGAQTIARTQKLPTKTKMSPAS
jgi:DNA polymerase-3 subunit alpha